MTPMQEFKLDVANNRERYDLLLQDNDRRVGTHAYSLHADGYLPVMGAEDYLVPITLEAYSSGCVTVFFAMYPTFFCDSTTAMKFILKWCIQCTVRAESIDAWDEIITTIELNDLGLADTDSDSE